MVALADLERWTRADLARDELFRVVDDLRARKSEKTAEEVEGDIDEEIAAMRAERARSDAGDTEG